MVSHLERLWRKPTDSSSSRLANAHPPTRRGKDRRHRDWLERCNKIFLPFPIMIGLDSLSVSTGRISTVQNYKSFILIGIWGLALLRCGCKFLFILQHETTLRDCKTFGNCITILNISGGGTFTFFVATFRASQLWCNLLWPIVTVAAYVLPSLWSRRAAWKPCLTKKTLLNSKAHSQLNIVLLLFLLLFFVASLKQLSLSSLFIIFQAPLCTRTPEEACHSPAPRPARPAHPQYFATRNQISANPWASTSTRARAPAIMQPSPPPQVGPTSVKGSVCNI